jgi:glycerophosphoryl diester phosphodiesterase
MDELILGSSTDRTVRINYRSDFPLAVRLNNFTNFPDCDFELRATVDNEVKSYCVEKKDGVCKNCKVQGDQLVIFFNNHGLSTGRLKIEMILYVPDPNYADGFRQEYYSTITNILLVEGNSDVIDNTVPSTPNSPVASVQLTNLGNAVRDVQAKLKELQAATGNGGGISSDSLAGKQDRIEDLDTIRSNSNQVAGKLSKEEADQYYQPKGHYLTEHQDISGLVSKEEADRLYKKVGDAEGSVGTSVDLSGVNEELAKKLSKTEAAELYQPKGTYLTEHQDISSLLSESSADEKYQTKITDLDSIREKAGLVDGKLGKEEARELYQPKGEYYTKSEVDVKIGNISTSPSSPSGQASGEFNPRGVWNKTNTTKIEAYVDNKGKFTRSANFNSYLIPAEGIDKITITGAGATDTVPCVFSCFNKFLDPLTSTELISISRAETAKTVPTNYTLTSSDIPAGTKMVVVSSRIVDSFTGFDFSIEYDKLNTTSRYAQSLSDCDYMAPSSAVLAKDLLFINITDRLVQGNVTITASGWNVNQANPKRCYCMIELNSGITVHIPSELRSYIGIQDKSGVYSFVPWTTGKYTTTKDGKYCFLLSKIDNTDLWITDLGNYPPFKLEVVGKSTLEVIMNSLKLHGIDVLSNKVNTESTGKDYSKYDTIIKGVNHRGWTGLGAAQDTLDAYKDSFTMGFRYVEVDVHKTSDDKFIIGHNDELPDRLVNPATGAKGSTVKIAEHTLEELKAFKDSKGGTVTELSEFCKLCKTYGLHPYIETKKAFDEPTMYKILDIITRSGLNYNFTIISFIEWTLESSIKYDDKIRVGLIYDKVQDNTIDDVVMRINKIKSKSTNRINVFLDANGQYFKTPSEAVMTKLLANKLPLEVWTMDTEADVLALDSYVSGVTSNTVHAGKVLHDKR